MTIVLITLDTFLFAAAEGKQSNGRYSIKSIEYKDCNKLTRNSQGPYFYY